MSRAVNELTDQDKK